MKRFAQSSLIGWVKKGRESGEPVDNLVTGHARTISAQGPAPGRDATESQSDLREDTEGTEHDKEAEAASSGNEVISGADSNYNLTRRSRGMSKNSKRSKDTAGSEEESESDEAEDSDEEPPDEDEFEESSEEESDKRKTSRRGIHSSDDDCLAVGGSEEEEIDEDESDDQRSHGKESTEEESDEDASGTGIQEEYSSAKQNEIASTSSVSEAKAESSGFLQRKKNLTFPHNDHGSAPSLGDVDLPGRPYQNPGDLPPPQILKTRTVPFPPSWYKEFIWLHYKPGTGRVFCYSCTEAFTRKLFPPLMKLEKTFISKGVKNWSKGKKKLKNHQKSKQHVDAVYLIEPKQTVPSTFKKGSKLASERNRKALLAIITSIKFLAKQGLAIRGKDKDDGNLMELLKLRSNEIPELKSRLSNKQRYTSPEIQNEILQIMALNLLRTICAEIRDAKWFSLMVDETTDSSTKEQVSICLRFVDDKYVPHEHFMGLYETASTTGETITKIILDALQRFDLSIDNLRGQCYDGASNMKGRIQGVQSRILELQPRAVYVHCFNHSLNLALQDSVRGIPKIRDAHQYVNDASVLIGKSPKRLASLEKAINECDLQNQHSLKPFCPTRWCLRVRSIVALLENYEAVIQVLHQLGESNDKCATVAAGLCSNFEKGETFFTLLRVEIYSEYQNILPPFSRSHPFQFIVQFVVLN